jgi:hypothetical protein
MASDPFLHVESGLKQIDVDLLAKSNSLITMIGAVATQYTLDFIKQHTDNLDITLTELKESITADLLALQTSISADLAAGFPGVQGTITITTPTVTDVEDEILPVNNTNRKYYGIFNTGADPIYIAFDVAATTASFPLPPGSSWDSTGIPAIYVGSVRAVAGTGISVQIHVLEGTS